MPSSASPTLRLRPEIGQLPSLIAYIERMAGELSMGPADSNAFALAAEELFANTINYSKPPATWVEFSLAADDGMMTARYSDDAAAFDPTLHPEPDTHLPVAERRIGGLGIHLVRRTMPLFRYERVGATEGGSNHITFGRPLAR